MLFKQGGTVLEVNVIMEQKRNLSQEDNREQSKEETSSPFTNEIFPVIQERTVVHNEMVETGKVHINKSISKEDVNVNTPIINETYHIERVPVKGQILDTPPPSMRYEGEVMIIPVLKEIPVVVKRYEVVEEIRITKKQTETPLIQKVTLSKQNINVERTQNETDK
jgi:uncharacterized protein (TIGR02271 family)